MMTKNFNDLALLLMRLGFGGLMLTHGIPKLTKLGDSPIEFADPIGRVRRFRFFLSCQRVARGDREAGAQGKLKRVFLVAFHAACLLSEL